MAPHEADAGDANAPTTSLLSAKQVKVSSEARQIGRFQTHWKIWLILVDCSTSFNDHRASRFYLRRP